nr:MAG TPA: hypothetical protein [Caudoviricetes sp.]
MTSPMAIIRVATLNSFGELCGEKIQPRRAGFLHPLANNFCLQVECIIAN